METCLRSHLDQRPLRIHSNAFIRIRARARDNHDNAHGSFQRDGCVENVRPREGLWMRRRRREDLNAVLHHARDVVRQTARVLDLQVGGDAHEQSDDARYASRRPFNLTDEDDKEVRGREIGAIVPKHAQLAVELRMRRLRDRYHDEKRHDETAVQVVVEGQLPAVWHHVRQVVLEEDGVEGAHDAGSQAVQCSL